MLLSLYSLMQTIGIAAARHDTSRKFINDDNLIVLNNVILISVHRIVCSECKDYAVLYLEVLRICQIIDMEELLNLMYTLIGK